jgi:hypothetical protein
MPRNNLLSVCYDPTPRCTLYIEYKILMYSTVQATSPLMSALVMIKRTGLHVIFMESGLLQYCFQNISQLRNDEAGDKKNRVQGPNSERDSILPWIAFT